jgi:glycosyltransferase involved in cell wall biosynthesis
MRVAHVITRLIVGGAQENTIATVLGLRQKPSVEVRLFAGPTSGPEGTLEHEVAGTPGLLTIVPSLIRPVRPDDDFRAYRELAGWFRKFQPDIVHTHSGKAGILGRLAAHRAGARVIVHTIHGPSFGPFQGPLANLIFRTAERLAGRFTTHFVSVADAMSDQYLDAGIGRDNQYTRIFSGFPLHSYLAATNDLTLRASLGIQPQDFVLGKIARLFELKGHDDLFQIAVQLVRSCPKIKFLLVGGGPWRGRFEEQARALGLGDRFIFA